MHEEFGPKTEFSNMMHGMKYRANMETFDEFVYRFCYGVMEDNDHYHRILPIIGFQRFLPAGRNQAAIGSLKHVTSFNCFVMDKLEDDLATGQNSIMDIARQAAKTMQMGGGVGYDFSTLRARGMPIASLESHSSGPVSFMHVFDAVCRAIMSAGHRRGAQMGVLRVDHPDIQEFVRAKQNDSNLTGFNISVAITDEFMEAVDKDGPFELRFGNYSRIISARELMQKIMRSTWDFAEPGVLFIDTINRMNNLWYCEKIAATNPCGEQPLPPNGACLLGSFNLVKYIGKTSDGYNFDWKLLSSDVPPIVLAMDNIIDRTNYPLEAQEKEAKAKRRMGLGITGFANASEILGFPYGSEKSLQFLEQVLEIIRDEAYETSIKIAKDKGAFPLFNTKYLKGKFIATLPEHLRNGISKYGIRNSHLTSIAPTGTISLCADNVSGGIEPVFELEQERKIFTPDGLREFRLRDYAYEFYNVHGKTTDEIDADTHVKVLTTAQKFVDSACSKTINMDGNIMPWGDFEAIYHNAYKGGAKGCSTYNKSGKRSSILKAATKESPKETIVEGATCEIDPQTGKVTCA